VIYNKIKIYQLLTLCVLPLTETEQLLSFPVWPTARLQVQVYKARQLYQRRTHELPYTECESGRGS